MGTDYKKEDIQKINTLLSEKSGIENAISQLTKLRDDLQSEVKVLEDKKDVIAKETEAMKDFQESSIKLKLDDLDAREKAVKEKEGACDEKIRKALNAVTERENLVTLKEGSLKQREESCILAEKRIQEKLDEAGNLVSLTNAQKIESDSNLSNSKKALDNAELLERENQAKSKILLDKENLLNQRESELKDKNKEAARIVGEGLKLKAEYEEKLEEIEEREVKSKEDLENAKKEIEKLNNLKAEVEVIQKQSADTLKNLEAFKLELDIKEGRLNDIIKKHKITEKELE